MAFRDRGPEVRDVGRAEPVQRLAPRLDGRAPAGAQDDEGVVRRLAGLLGEVCRRLARLVEGAAHPCRPRR